MKLSLFRSQQPPSYAAGDEELDVTPVMNMFIILIPFLVSMAVFTRLSIIEFSVPPNVGTEMNTQDTKPVPKLTIRIGHDYIGIVRGDQLLDSLPVYGNTFPMTALRERLIQRKTALQYHDEIIIASKDSVAFKYIVAVMDMCREEGLERVGLSSATNSPDVHP